MAADKKNTWAIFIIFVFFRANISSFNTFLTLSPFYYCEIAGKTTGKTKGCAEYIQSSNFLVFLSVYVIN